MRFCFILTSGYGVRKSIWKKLVGKFNSVFIAPSAYIGSNYYQHASRTSNNTIPLLMTEMKRTHVNIIQFHPCTVCSELQWEKVMKYQQDSVAEAIGVTKTWSYKRRKWNKIRVCPFPSSQGIYCTVKRSCKCNWCQFHKMKFKYIHEDLLVSGEREGRSEEKVWKSDKIKKVWAIDVELELEWQIKQHFTFSDNTTVLGPDFQTDIKFVPEWWNAFMIHYLSSNWIWSAPSFHPLLIIREGWGKFSGFKL